MKALPGQEAPVPSCELEMPFTAKFVVEHYIGKGQYNAELYGGVADGREVVFTPMPEF